VVLWFLLWRDQELDEERSPFSWVGWAGRKEDRVVKAFNFKRQNLVLVPYVGKSFARLRAGLRGLLLLLATNLFFNASIMSG
jgi:hypothetical protein